MTKSEKFLAILSFILNTIGFGLIWYYFGFKLVAFIFLILWGNNLMLNNRFIKR